MKREIKQKFFSYINIAKKKFRAYKTKSSKRVNTQLFLNKSAEIRSIVDNIESLLEFKELEKAIESTFPEVQTNLRSNITESPLQTFFRKSYVYINLYDGIHQDYSDLFRNLVDAFEADQMEIIYIAPLAEVDFSGANMNFGKFQIRRFKTEELDDLCLNKVNKIFYEHAVIKTEEISHYWFICVSETHPVAIRDPLAINLKELVMHDEGIVEFKYSDLPNCFDYALKQIALYYWDEFPEYTFEKKNERKSYMWYGFDIPFILQFNKSLIDPPIVPPAHYGPMIIAENVETIDGFVEVDRPYFNIVFDKEETSRFNEHIRKTIHMISTINFEKNKWHFWERALRFLTKAFFIYDAEQILWHLSSLEALLGQDQYGLTKPLGSRIAKILGKTERERKYIRKKFNDIYNIRSRLLHGDDVDKAIYQLHLRQARIMARRAMIWFLHLLYEIQRKIAKDVELEKVPKRDDILRILEEDKLDRDRLSLIIKTVPDIFPYVKEWNIN